MSASSGTSAPLRGCARDHFRQADDSGALDRKPQRRLGVVRGHARPHLDHVDAGAGLERPAIETGAGDEDAVVIAESAGDRRRAAAPDKTAPRRSRVAGRRSCAG